jgi:hypothetical protein
MAGSISPSLVSSFAPASPPRASAQAYATLLDALAPPCSYWMTKRKKKCGRDFVFFRKIKESTF